MIRLLDRGQDDPGADMTSGFPGEASAPYVAPAAPVTSGFPGESRAPFTPPGASPPATAALPGAAPPATGAFAFLKNRLRQQAAPQTTDPQTFVQQWFAAGNTARQSQPQSLAPLVAAMKAAGHNVTLAAPSSGGYVKGIMLDGHFVKLLDGNDHPMWGFDDNLVNAGGGGSAPSGMDWASLLAQLSGGTQTSAYGDPAGGMDLAGGNLFDDPSTHLLEQYLTQQLGQTQVQQRRQTAANEGARGQLPEAQASAQRLIDYLTQRAGTLQQAPYTGTEQEILRTQALDPIEADRQAAQQRTLETLGARGLTPESGISQALINSVDAGYDRQRAGAQNDLAYRTITETRSRQQEAQQLLALIPELQRSGLSGDLAFQQALDASENKLGGVGGEYATQLQQLPSQALLDALRTMGIGPGTNDLYNQSLGLYGVNQQQQQQQGDDMEAIGQLLALLIGGGDAP